ncbi:hypothetical protein [Helicobacter rodentium]|uniref:hypothetical protein n=1 Tax=Helicobacter rodentium TaxID=59617 RepID=UPI0026EF5D12|nr:hypothetical protein [Helicobacter rodentium]
MPRFLQRNLTKTRQKMPYGIPPYQVATKIFKIFAQGQTGFLKKFCYNTSF